jgi:hypothetical protein
MSRSVPVCPHCVQADERPIVCDRCGWRWHANPLPAAAVLLERQRDGMTEILLLRRALRARQRGDRRVPSDARRRIGGGVCGLRVE